MSRSQAPSTLRDFASAEPDCRAVLQRVGAGIHDLVLISGNGRWARAEFETVEAAREAASSLGLEVAEGWDDAASRLLNERDNWSTPDGQRRAL